MARFLWVVVIAAALSAVTGSAAAKCDASATPAECEAQAAVERATAAVRRAKAAADAATKALEEGTPAMAKAAATKAIAAAGKAQIPLDKAFSNPQVPYTAIIEIESVLASARQQAIMVAAAASVREIESSSSQPTRDAATKAIQALLKSEAEDLAAYAHSTIGSPDVSASRAFVEAHHFPSDTYASYGIVAFPSGATQRRETDTFGCAKPTLRTCQNQLIYLSPFPNRW